MEQKHSAEQRALCRSFLCLRVSANKSSMSQRKDIGTKFIVRIHCRMYYFQSSLQWYPFQSLINHMKLRHVRIEWSCLFSSFEE